MARAWFARSKYAVGSPYIYHLCVDGKPIHGHFTTNDSDRDNVYLYETSSFKEDVQQYMCLTCCSMNIFYIYVNKMRTDVWVIKGQYQKAPIGTSSTSSLCTTCGFDYLWRTEWKFCPICGTQRFEDYSAFF